MKIEDFTRIAMSRDINVDPIQGLDICSVLHIDLLHLWTYEDSRSWVNMHFHGWRFGHAEHYIYTPAKGQYLKNPGTVLPTCWPGSSRNDN